MDFRRENCYARSTKMPADRDSRAPVAPFDGEQGPASGSALDPAGLARIVRDFNLARTNAALYPLDHPLIAGSLDRAYEGLRETDASVPPLTLAAAKDGLIAGGQRLDPRSSAFREFAAALSERNILSVTFGPGFTRGDLVLLHRVLNMNSEDLWARGGPLETARGMGLERIVIREFDYSRFQATESGASAAGTQAEARAESGRLWDRFVGRVLAEDTAGDARDSRPVRAQTVDPALLARFINADPEGALAALRNYSGLLSENDGRPPEPPILGKMGGLLRRLKPELKSQLLSMTFDEWKDRDDVAWDGLGEDLVVEMLEQAGRERQKIPPALANLVNALSALKGTAGADVAEPGRTSGGEDPEVVDKFQRFFSQESRTSFVDIEYGEVLDRLSRTARSSDSGDAAAGQGVPERFLPHGWRESLAADLEAALDPERALIRIWDLLTSLLDSDLEPEDLAAFARAIAARSPALLAAGEYERLDRALCVLERRAAGADGPAAGAVLDALASFREPGFVLRAVRKYPAGAGTSAGAAAFFRTLGRPAVRALVDLYVGGDFPSGGGRLAQLLSELREAASEEMGHRLADGDEVIVRQVLHFYRRYGASSDLSVLRPFLAHADDQVRTDALAALLAVGGGEAEDGLLRALGSPVGREAMAAVRLAGQHRRAEAVPSLLRMISAGMFRMPDGPLNLEIVRALGRIGDPAALPGLERLVRRRDPLHPGERRNLKLAIFESLDGYPPDSLAEFLSAGLKAKDSRIRAVCRSIQRRGAEPGPAPGRSGRRKAP